MPGPAPVFTERLDVKVSPEQRALIETWALVMGVSVSEVVRTFLMAAVDDMTDHVRSDPGLIAAAHQAQEKLNAKV